MAYNDLFGLRVRFVTGLSNWQIRLYKLGQEVNVADGESQSVHLGESFLVGQGRYVGAQALERVIDGLHPPPLPDVGSLPYLLHLHLRTHTPPPLQQWSTMMGHLWGQIWVAVGAAVRKCGGRGGEGQVADVIVSIVKRCSAATVFTVILLEMTGEEFDIVIQKIISVQVSVSRGLVGEKLIIFEIGRGGERVESGERV